jgi:uncharacterized phage-associated protein
MPHSSLAIANEFIKKSLEPDARPLTHMQLQKLVYLAHGWNLGAHHQPMIEDPVEAWKFGPVIRRLYEALSYAGSGPIPAEINWGDDTSFVADDDGIAYEELTASEAGIVKLVWDTYGSYPAFKLSALTHQPNTPWSETFEAGSNKVIPNSVIERHFESLIAA